MRSRIGSAILCFEKRHAQYRVALRPTFDRSEQRSLLERCAQTALNSKLIAHQKEFFGQMAVDAVMSLEDDLNLKMIGVKKVAGGSLTDSVLIKGVAFKKTFSYAGFEQQVRVEQP